MELTGIFADCGPNFVSNPEPKLGEMVEIAIRVCAGDFGDGDISLCIGGADLSCKKVRTVGLFDYFAAALPCPPVIEYYFTLKSNGIIYHYNHLGISEDYDPAYNFTIFADYHTPDWAKGQAMYQIFVDRFANGDPGNDVLDNQYLYLGRLTKRITNWSAPIENTDFANFYGGDLAGIIEKMAYLRDLGVGAIYLNPVFVSPSNHKYDTQDYDYVDPHYGVIINDGGAALGFDTLHNKHASMHISRITDAANLEASNQLLARLIRIAHEHNIRVILDGVFNHCGAFHKWLDSEGFYGGGALNEPDSPYRDYFIWDKHNKYEAWWGHDNHPKLNFEGSRDLYDYILRIGAKWVSPPFNADGWRLDVAADLGKSREFNQQFWADFRDAVKAANPEAIIIAEHYGDPAPWLDGRQWDTIMNYDAFMDPIGWFFTGMQKHSEAKNPDLQGDGRAFEAAMRYHNARMPWPALQTAMNQISNHDHARFLTRTNMTIGRLHTKGAFEADMGINKALMMAAVLMQFSWPGCPTIYYGDEAGLAGWTDPDNRRPYPWGREDRSLIALHRAAGAIRAAHPALQTGSLEFLQTHGGIVAYGRWNGEESLICAFNATPQPIPCNLEAWRANFPKNGNATCLIQSTGGDFTTNPGKIPIKKGILSATLPPRSATIFIV
ncbi:MAG: glycoside hydrolase family 13 protein [Defluviitaleaceae bacterium]|nr:glycoside hydrolase family 13 protein [Defluviitaleaceae bacterium]